LIAEWFEGFDVEAQHSLRRRRRRGEVHACGSMAQFPRIVPSCVKVVGVERGA
jgi:hypothetical protein